MIRKCIAALWPAREPDPLEILLSAVQFLCALPLVFMIGWLIMALTLGMGEGS